MINTRQTKNRSRIKVKIFNRFVNLSLLKLNRNRKELGKLHRKMVNKFNPWKIY
jgi:L-cystine uptake protein TcyP (sodium:dicarboxylate symporter family)